MLESFNCRDLLTRRQFLTVMGRKLIGFSGIYAMSRLPGVSGKLSSPEEPVSNLTREEAFQRLYESGLGDYCKLYSRLNDFRNKYIYTFYAKILDILDNEAAGKSLPEGIEPENIRKLNDGWDSFGSSDIDIAVEHLNSLTIDTERTGENPNKVKNFFRVMANVFPPFVYVLPPTVVMVPTNGGNSSDPLRMEIASSKDYEAFVWVSLHEPMHPIYNNWEIVKPFVSKQNFLNYLCATMDFTDNILSSWCNVASENEAMHFVKNDSLIRYPLNPPERKDPEREKKMATDIKRLEEMEQSFLPNPAIPSGFEKNYEYRFSRMAWHFMRRFFDIRMRSASQTYLSTEDCKFLEDPNFVNVLTITLGQTFHRCFDFITSREGVHQLARSSEDINNDELTGQLIRLQEMKIAAFSTLPQNISFQDLRTRLGLS